MTMVSLRAVRTRAGVLGADGRVAVLGVLNVTPDSFSDGGRYVDPEAAAGHGEAMVAAGADGVDLGGESTRPGAAPVPCAEELRRVLPALRRLRSRIRVPISIDTSKAEVARAALAEGADLVNDVSAGRLDPQMLATVAAAGVPIVLMHMRGTPRDMQEHPAYPGDDVVGAVVAFLDERAATARAAGVAADRIVLDVGLGFGKTTAHNLALVNGLDAVRALGYPVLVGPSRKRFVADVVGGDPQDRVEGTAAAVALAVARGAAIVRVHDVGPMVRVVRMAEAICGATQPRPAVHEGA
jgi:dihydropteroate synthase